MPLSLQTLPGIEDAVPRVQPFNVATSPVISNLLTAHAPVALGVSGGKDSGAMSLAVSHYLDEIGHRGPRLLIHSDLGRVEWRESLPMCQRLADFLNMELVVVRRAAGDLLSRWQTRWLSNVARFANLETVQLILPWSTPSMLFCRSELKAAPICRELIARFPNQVIISGTGIRREESSTRANAPISLPNLRLSNTTHGTSGLDWHPIADWTLSEVLEYHRLRGFALHPGYARGMTRISCIHCIMSSEHDIAISTSCEEHLDLYREEVDIEILSSFAFQRGRWLGDVRPDLLSEIQQRGLAEAKLKAITREAAERRIPRHLRFTKGWPTIMPTREEARLLAEVRCTVADTLGLLIHYRDTQSVLDRYEQLMTLARQKKRLEAARPTAHPADLWQEREVLA